MIDLLGLHRAHDADVVCDAADVRQEIADRLLRLAKFAERGLRPEAQQLFALQLRDWLTFGERFRHRLAVHRGEVVSVLARAGGIRIRTNARAREEGSVGELVAVESLLNRSTYYARVSGTREVEVFARPPQVANEQ